MKSLKAYTNKQRVRKKKKKKKIIPKDFFFKFEIYFWNIIDECVHLFLNYIPWEKFCKKRKREKSYTKKKKESTHVLDNWNLVLMYTFKLILLMQIKKAHL